MIPLIFGSAGRRLAGVFTPAIGRRQSRGVVLCPPLGQEMIRSYRTCRLLATRMAEAGLDVLRFDYFGTGESAGDWGDLTVEGSVEDVGTAVIEISDLAGVDKVSLVGLRVGALFAAMSCGASDAVDRLALWDPVTDGNAYVDRYLLAGELVGSDGSIERHGFLFGPSFQRSLTALRLAAVRPLPERILYVVSEKEDEHRSVFGTLNGVAARSEFVTLANEPAWTEMGNLGVGATPTDIIEAIAGW